MPNVTESKTKERTVFSHVDYVPVTSHQGEFYDLVDAQTVCSGDGAVTAAQYEASR